MSTRVEIPSLGESITEAVIAKWLKPDGAKVAIDEPICELETDKANVELPAPAAGILRRMKNEGDSVKIAEQVASIEEGSAAPDTKAAASAGDGNGKPKTPKPEAEVREKPEADADARLSPAVRNLVEENRINAADLKGSGPSGRVLKEDVMRYLEARGKKSAPTPTLGSVLTHPSVKPAPQTTLSGASSSEIRREPMSKIRKKIAERLVAVQHQTAMLTTFNEIDMSAVLDLRARYKESFAEAHGVSLGLMSFFARATALALKAFPVVNASIDGEDILYHEAVNLGIAVSTDRGLVVPILHRVEAMSFSRIESEIKRTATAARDGKLSLQELSGGTFTITNGGVFGSLMSTPILNAPQSAILGMHAILKRPIAVGDKVEIRPMMYVALSYDHRLIDGKDSVSFLVRIKQLLEDPARLLLEV